jgi:cell division protein FtsB
MQVLKWSEAALQIKSGHCARSELIFSAKKKIISSFATFAVFARNNYVCAEFCFRCAAPRDLLFAMNVDLGIWSKLTRVVIFLLLLAVVLGIAIWYLPLIQQNERMRKEVLRLDTQIQKEDDTSKQLKGSIDSLHNDPKAVERLARERLGYAKPGETVVRFEGTNTANPATP